MNEKYFGYRLQRVQTFNSVSEIVLALTASAAVSSWQFLHTGYGASLWQLFGALSTLIAILKPIIKLSKDIELYSKLHVGYCSLYFDLKNLVREANFTRRYSVKMLKEEISARERYKNLELQLHERPNRRLLLKCMAEVNRQIPPESLWLPELGGEHELPRTTTTGAST